MARLTLSQLEVIPLPEIVEARLKAKEREVARLRRLLSLSIVAVEERARQASILVLQGQIQ